MLLEITDTQTPGAENTAGNLLETTFDPGELEEVSLREESINKYLCTRNSPPGSVPPWTWLCCRRPQHRAKVWIWEKPLEFKEILAKILVETWVKETRAGGWADGSRGIELAEEVWDWYGISRTYVKQGMVAHICNFSVLLWDGMDTGHSLEAHGLANLGYAVATNKRDLHQIRWKVRTNAWGCLLTCTHTNKHGRVCTYTSMHLYHKCIEPSVSTQDKD